jgi:hypothetical protein
VDYRGLNKELMGNVIGVPRIFYFLFKVYAVIY